MLAAAAADSLDFSRATHGLMLKGNGRRGRNQILSFKTKRPAVCKWERAKFVSRDVAGKGRNVWDGQVLRGLGSLEEFGVVWRAGIWGVGALSGNGTD